MEAISYIINYHFNEQNLFKFKLAKKVIIRHGSVNLVVIILNLRFYSNL